MKILIINQHTLNFGDDVAGISLIQNLLEYKELEKINLIYNTKGKLPFDNKKVFHNPNIMLKNIGYWNLIKYFVLRTFGYKKFKNTALKQMIEIINEADYIFVSPCGANLGIYKDWRFLIKLLIVIKEEKKPIFYLNTIGKSDSIIFNFFARRVLKKSTIYVREKKSLEYVKSLGLNAEFGVDSAFSFKSEGKTNKRNAIAFIPTVLKNWHPNFKNVDIDDIVFNKILPVIAEFSKENQLEVKLIPHLRNDEEDIYYNKIFDILKRLNVNVYYMKNVNTVYDYNNAIKESKILVGMRYHSIVLAVKNNIPFISLAYENKMQEVCNYSDMKKYSLKLYDDNFNANVFKEKLEEVYKNKEEIEKRLKKVVNEKLIALSKLPLKEIKN